MIRSCGIGETRLTMYHGTPYTFERFEDETTYFSDTIGFACDYAREKSQDRKMDADITVIECEFGGRLFDINYASCERLLRDVLPEKIYVGSSMFYGMFGKDYPKDVVIERMKGRETVEPLEVFLKAKVGDTIPKPEYSYENLMVLKKTSDYIVLFDEPIFKQIVDAISRTDTRWGGSSEQEYRKEWGRAGKEYLDYIGEIEERERKKLKEKTSSPWVYLPMYPDFLTPEEQQKATMLKKDIETKLKVEILKRGSSHLKKIPLKVYSEELRDTWRYFENDEVLTSIKKIGFDGYVAKERGENTYAVFSPSKTITIVRRVTRCG